jgi:hypothetical protein
MEGLRGEYFSRYCWSAERSWSDTIVFLGVDVEDLFIGLDSWICVEIWLLVWDWDCDE